MVQRVHGIDIMYRTPPPPPPPPPTRHRRRQHRSQPANLTNRIVFPPLLRCWHNQSRKGAMSTGHVVQVRTKAVATGMLDNVSSNGCCGLIAGGSATASASTTAFATNVFSAKDIQYVQVEEVATASMFNTADSGSCCPCCCCCCCCSSQPESSAATETENSQTLKVYLTFLEKPILIKWEDGSTALPSDEPACWPPPSHDNPPGELRGRRIGVRVQLS